MGRSPDLDEEKRSPELRIWKLSSVEIGSHPSWPRPRVFRGAAGASVGHLEAFSGMPALGCSVGRRGADGSANLDKEKRSSEFRIWKVNMVKVGSHPLLPRPCAPQRCAPRHCGNVCWKLGSIFRNASARMLLSPRGTDGSVDFSEEKRFPEFRIGKMSSVKVGSHPSLPRPCAPQRRETVHAD